MKLILFDFDDTLINTNKVFRDNINTLKYLLVNETGKSFEEITEIYKRIHTQGYEKFHVDFINLWPYILDVLKEELNLNSETQKKVLELLDKVLKDVPELKEGVIETLDILKEKGFTLGLVTHALKDWTYFKLESHGLSKYFDHIEIADARATKSVDCWQRAIKHFNIDPSESMVVGDNINGDIIAASSAGVKKLFWVDFEQGWSMYRTGQLPEGTVTIKKISEILEYV